MVIVMTTAVTHVIYVNICKVKVTKDDEISILCPEHISYTHEGILTKLHRNVHHYEKLCRTHEPGL
jgi:hypothetical protein